MFKLILQILVIVFGAMIQVISVLEKGQWVA